MRIAVANTHVPFVRGGAESHAAKLVEMLKLHGHEAEQVTLPFKWYPHATLVDGIMAAKLTDISEADGARIDMMIGLRFPAYLIPHPNPVFWVLHQHRAAFDLWDDPGANYISRDPEGMALRQLIADEERAAFARSSRPVFANSRNVAGRLQRFIGQDAVPLYHPPPMADRLAPGEFGDYIFAPGRLNRLKRPELMPQALVHAPGARLAIAGEAAQTQYRDSLVDLAHNLGVSDRVMWLGRVSDEDLLAYYAGARAVLFPPVDEDYGYITLEAMLAGKPVITTTDAGGPLEFIRDGEEGLICAPDAASLGQAMLRLSGDLALAKRLGAAGRARYDSLNISWEHAVSALTGEACVPAPAPRDIVAGSGADKAETIALPCAPETPAGCAFDTARDFAAAWAFAPASPLSAVTLSRLEAEWGLSQHLAAHAQKTPARHVLDAQLEGPAFFPALLAHTLPELETLTAMSPKIAPYQGVLKACDDRVKDVALTILPETERAAIRPETYDLVIGRNLDGLSSAEGLQTFLNMANRVLELEGVVIACLHNCARLDHVARVFGASGEDESPAGLSVSDVAHLATEAGFEKRLLETVAPNGAAPDPRLVALLSAGGDDLSLRGDVIVFVGHKIAPPQICAADGSEALEFGAISLADDGHGDGLLRLEIHNQSPRPWLGSGRDGVSLVLDWEDDQGHLTYSDLHRPLPYVIAAGARATLALPVAVEPGEGVLHVRLCRNGLSGPCFTNRVSLPCRHASVKALLASGGQGWEQK